MRIVLASFGSLPHSVGGGEVHLHALAKALQALGHQPSILTIERTGAEMVSHRREHFDGLPVDYLIVPEHRSQYYRDPCLSRWAKAWLKEQGVDIVHLFLFSHLLGLIPAAKELNIPVCLTALEFSYFCRRYDMLFEGRELCELGKRGEVCERCVLAVYSKKQRLLASVTRLLPPALESRIRETGAKLTGQDRLVALGQRSVTNLIEAQRTAFNREIAAVITPSSIMKEFFRANGVADSKIHLIPYGTDVKGELKETAGRNGSSELLRVGYIGRLDPKKGIDLLCEAIKTFPRDLPISVKILGPLDSVFPEFVSKLKSLVADEPRIQLLGPLERDKLQDAFSDLDVLVLPSILYENSPVSISEALVFRCPVICSDSAGMTDLIQDGINGLTFPTGDSAALARCLRRLIEDRELLPKLQQQIRPIESVNNVAGRIIRVYEIISGKHCAVSSSDN